MAERLNSQSAWWVGFYGKSNNYFLYLYSASIKNKFLDSILSPSHSEKLMPEQLKQVLEEKFSHHINEPCFYRWEGRKCCHNLNPVRKYGCKILCGREAVYWIQDNYSHLSDAEATSILEELVTDS